MTSCAFRGWDFNLETLNSRQRLGQTLNLLRFRVQLSEYYNFGRIDLLDDVEPWCVGVSEMSGSVGQCRASVGPVSVDTSVGVSGSVGTSVGAVSGYVGLS